MGGLLRVGQRVFHAVQQHAPVGQAGERIKVGQLVRPRLGLLALGDVARERDEPGFVARRSTLLARNRQLKPVGHPAQLQPELVA